jgi:hypothetical protein
MEKKSDPAPICELHIYPMKLKEGHQNLVKLYFKRFFGRLFL